MFKEVATLIFDIAMYLGYVSCEEAEKLDGQMSTFLEEE